jgi:hypothetical protein
MKDEGLAYTLLKRLQRKTLALKMELVLFGILTLLVGIYPSLAQRSMLPAFLSFLPVEGLGYQSIIIVLGGLALLIGIRTSRR